MAHFSSKNRSCRKSAQVGAHILPWAGGGQLPLREPPVILESFRKTASEHVWKFFQFNAPQEVVIMPEQLESSDDSSSTSGSSSNSESAKSVASGSKSSKPVPVGPSVDELETGSYRDTMHIILNWGDPSTPESNRRVKTACGRFFPSCNIVGRNDMVFRSDKNLCTHPGCRKGWQSAGALE